MSQTSDNNKRIAKNTLFLYLRMIFLLFVSLYTSRVILAQLGVVDYGLYNVVGSLVLMFSFIQGSLSSATSRFLAYDIGKEDSEALNKTFCMTLNVHLIFALLVLFISETIGLWYFYEKMVIPQSRLTAAAIVYQLSNLNAIMAIIVIPYRSMIIAKEKMGAFAYISIVEAVIKLGIAFCLCIGGIDKLIVYGSLLCLSQLVVNYIYFLYCKKEFSEVVFHKYWDKKQFYSMFSFSGWSVCSYLSSNFVSQTFNLLLNMFFGPVVNAARAIAYQVQGAVSNFSVSFQIALNPQIIKNFAVKDIERMNDLVQLSIKASFSLLLILLAPLLINVDFVLGLWLKEVPAYSGNFLILIGCISIFASMANPLSVVAEAANRLKLYNLTTMPFYLMSIPIAYLLLKAGRSVYVVFIITLITECVGFFIKLWIASEIIKIDRRKIYALFLKALLCMVIVLMIGWYLKPYIHGITLSVVSIILSGGMAILLIYFIMLNKIERNSIKQKVSSFCKGLSNRS